MANDCPTLECGCAENVLFDYSLVNYPVYFNSELSFFIPCPPGFSCASGGGITITIPAGTISFRPTSASANSPGNVQQELDDRARYRAEEQALPQFFPAPGPNFRGERFWMNSQVDVQCEDGEVPGPTPNVVFFIGPGHVRIPTGLITSNTSQADANQGALNLATILQESYAGCHWENDEVTCDCEPPAMGGPFTIPAGTYQSTISKADANAQAEAACQAQIDANCVTCNNFLVSALTWDVVLVNTSGLSTYNVDAPNGILTANIRENDNINFTAMLKNSCDSYVVNVELDYTLQVFSNDFIQETKVVVIQFDDDAPSEVSFTCTGDPGFGPPNCKTCAGTISHTHTIDPDPYAPGEESPHKIFIAGSNNGTFGPLACQLIDMTVTITPLSPP